MTEYKKEIIKKYILYLFRWQMSSPLLAICLIWLPNLGPIWGSIVANFVGGLIFFWVDRAIFLRKRY